MNAQCLSYLPIMVRLVLGSIPSTIEDEGLLEMGTVALLKGMF